MGMEGAPQMPADESERIDNIEKAQAMAQASNEHSSRQGLENWKNASDEDEAKREQYIGFHEKRLEKTEELAGLQYDLEKFGYALPPEAIKQIKEILDANLQQFNR